MIRRETLSQPALGVLILCRAQPNMDMSAVHSTEKNGAVL